jgi:hypothetical protein
MQRKLASIHRPSCSHATFTICKRNQHATSVCLAYTQRVLSAYLAGLRFQALRLIMAAVVDRPRAAHACAEPGTGARPSHICIGTQDDLGMTPAHICAGTGLTMLCVRAATSPRARENQRGATGATPRVATVRRCSYVDLFRCSQSEMMLAIHGAGMAIGGGERPCHICAGTGLTPVHICAGTGLTPAHICARTGLTPAHICSRTGLTPATSAPRLGSPVPHLRRN